MSCEHIRARKRSTTLDTKVAFDTLVFLTPQAGGIDGGGGVVVVVAIVTSIICGFCKIIIIIAAFRRQR